MKILSSLIFAVTIFSISVYAAPPENADPALAPWFKSLKQPTTGLSCCDVADCRPVDYRIGQTGYEALVDENWIKIPDHAVLHNKENPVGRAVLCQGPVSGVIFCFIPGSET